MSGPVSVTTLDDALRWLAIYSKCEDYIFDAEATLPPEAQFACDMFWLSPVDLCRKLRTLWPDVHMTRRVVRRAGLRAIPYRGVR